MPKINKQALKKVAKKAGKKAVKATAKAMRDNLHVSAAPALENILHGLTDPFSEHAARAQYPDQGAGKTMTFTIKNTYTLATLLTTGSCAFALSVKPGYSGLTATSMSGTTATWAATFAPSNASALINTYGRTYRPISAGIRIANNLSATNSSGYLIVAKGGSMLPSGVTVIDPNVFSSYDLHPMEHGAEWHVVACPRSSNAYDFQAVSGSTSTSVETNWETIYVAYFGGPTSGPTSALFLETVLTFEYTVDEDAPIATLAVPQPIMDTGMMTAVNAVQSAHPNSHKGPRQVLTNFAKKEAKKALSKHVLPFVAKKAAVLL